jgi:hypothetical protein
MDPKRRFVFRGNAAAYGGRLYRPTDIIVEAKGASCLPVTGGRSSARLAAVRFDEVFRVGRASTLAEGFFDDARQAIELTHHRVAEGSLTTSTLVTAQLERLMVGVKPRLTIESMEAALRGGSPSSSREPTVALERAVIKGVAIGGHELIVELETEIFRRYDTRSKLVAAAEAPKFARTYGAHFFMPRAEALPRLFESGGIIHATIVKSLRWADKPYPGATIDGHTVQVPELGLLFFGEMLITEGSRRLTLARFELGSLWGGFLSAIDVDTNGGWSP